MNRYQVEWSSLSGFETDETVSSYVYVDATTREEAKYAAFDELCTQGVNMAALIIGAVSMEHESGKWIEIQEHTRQGAS